MPLVNNLPNLANDPSPAGKAALLSAVAQIESLLPQSRWLWKLRSPAIIAIAAGIIMHLSGFFSNLEPSSGRPDGS